MKLIFNGFPVLVQATAEECVNCSVALAIAVLLNTEDGRNKAIRHQYDLRSLFKSKFEQGLSYRKFHPVTHQLFEVEMVAD